MRLNNDYDTPSFFALLMDNSEELKKIIVTSDHQMFQ